MFQKKYEKQAVKWKSRVVAVVLSGAMVLTGAAVSPVTACAETKAADASAVSWVMTTEGNYWQEQPDLTTTEWSNEDKSGLYIDVDEKITYQKMAEHVWGGCFNERGWKYLNELSKEDREHILDLLFDPDEPDGLHITMGRIPIGASDFAIDHYSLDETPNDYELEHFSIERDKSATGIIPFIKEALKRQPNMKFWASPWSPPSWIKDNNNLIAGNIVYNEKNMTFYANYFRKFVEAYEAEGIHISMVSPQNEPTMWTAYTSCIWTGEQLRGFVRDYLGPEMEKIGVEIYLGTFTNSDDSLIDPTLNDPEAKDYISGITFQWWSYLKSHSLYHTGYDLGMMQSETMCGDGNNNWEYAEKQFDIMWMYLETGISAYNLWNMVLEWDGVNRGGHNTAANPWPQNAPITVNLNDKTYSINPHYYEYKHFTNYIQPGARRISSTGTYDEAFPIKGWMDNDSYFTATYREIAFRNPDGTNVLMVKNGSNEVKHVNINFNGRKVSVDLPAHSIHTFATAGTPLTGNETDMRQTIPEEEIVRLENKGTSQVLCVEGTGGRVADTSKILQWENEGQAHQQWYLEPSEVNGQKTVKIVNVKSEKIVAVDGGRKDPGTKLILWPYGGEANQNWIVEEADGGYVRFKNADSGHYLAGDAAAQAEQRSFSASDDKQLWKLVSVYEEMTKDDVASLEAAEEKARALKQDEYTKDSFDKVSAALETAKGIDRSKRADVVAARKSLKKALGGLVKGQTPVPVVVDKSALNAAVKDAAAKIESQYSPESWKKMQAALETAKKLQTDDAATQEQIDAAVKDLNDAIKALDPANHPGEPEKVNAPSSVKAEWIGRKNIKITWKQAEGADSYEVYRSYKKTSGFQKVATAKKTSYTDKKAAAGKTVYYKVIALKGDKKSGESNVSSAYIVKAPAGVKAKGGKKAVTVSFGKVKKASGYEIYQASKKNGKYKKAATLKSAKSTKKKIKLKKGKYFFKVRTYQTIKGKKIPTEYSKIVNARAK